jgi:hypothetical protein
LYLCEFLECNYSTESKQELKAHDHFHDIAYDRLYAIGAKGRVIEGKQGHLEQFMVVPLEALLAIFKYMGPGDLWNLARVNKRFRSLLLNRRKALSIWQAVSCLRCLSYVYAANLTANIDRRSTTFTQIFRPALQN